MIKIPFNFQGTSGQASQDGIRLRSKHSQSHWFHRLGRGSALAACLWMASPPLAAFGAEPFPAAAAASEPSFNANIAHWLEALSSDQAEARKTAAQKLSRMGTAAAPAIPELLKTLSDKDALVRAAAARAIWEIGGRADAAVPVLVELLESPDTSHRELAAYFLGPMGQAAKPALPALRQVLHEQDAGLRVHAAEALTQIDPAASDAVDVLLEALHHENSDVRSLAAMAFCSVAPIHAEKVVPVLTAALADPDPGVRTFVELAFSNFHRDAARSGLESSGAANSSIPSFPELFAGSEPVVPAAHNATPFSSSEKTHDHPLALTGELGGAVADLSNANPAVRKNALERIGWMGAGAEPALTDIIACLDDPQPEVRAYAAKTLWDVDPSSALAAINTLADMLDSTQPGVRPLAAFYLGYIGPDAATAIPTLKRALASALGAEQLQIAEAVARIQPQDPDAVTVLIGGLRDEESQVRFQAAYALSEVSPIHAERVLPELAAAMRDQSPQVRQAAELALASFPVPAPIAEPAARVPVVSAPSQEDIPEPAPTTQVVLLDPEPIGSMPRGPIQEPGVYDIAAAAPAGVANVRQPKESTLGLGEDYKPISAVNVTITPKRRDEDGQLLQLPTNYGAAWLQEVGTNYHATGESRPWCVQSVQYAASGFCHRPLYFEEINLERYGNNFGPCLQPFVSAAAFYGRVPLLPYMMAADHPWDCQYTLGHYRPGNCVPFQPSHLPWSTSGTLLEAGIITGLFFAIY